VPCYPVSREVLQPFRLSIKTPVTAILLKTQPLILSHLGTGGFCGTGVFTLESNLCNKCRVRFQHPGRYRRVPSFSSLHQNR
jgi:hypothetical protein